MHITSFKSESKGNHTFLKKNKLLAGKASDTWHVNWLTPNYLQGRHTWSQEETKPQSITLPINGTVGCLQATLLVKANISLPGRGSWMSTKMKTGKQTRSST